MDAATDRWPRQPPWRCRRLLLAGLCLGACRCLGSVEADLTTRRLADPCHLHLENFSAEASISRCKECVGLEGRCKWCSRSQTCESRGGGECDKRDGGLSFKTEEACDEQKVPEWIEGIGADYGDEHYEDFSRCIEHSLRWEEKSFRTFQEKYMPKQSDSEVAFWACKSALVRVGFRKMILSGQPRPKPAAAAAAAAAGAAARGAGEAASGPEEEEEEPGAGGAAADGRRRLRDWDSEVGIRPWICHAFIQRDEWSYAECGVWVFDPEEFEKLRGITTTPNHAGPMALTDILRASIESGPLVSFKPGAGKSGSTFARTYDGKFKIKVGIKASSSMDEPSNLLQLIKGDGGEAKSLIAHFKSNPDSYLNRYYGLVKYELHDTKQFVLLMGDASYGVDDRVSDLIKKDKSISYHRYDLKGKSRNQNNQQPGEFTMINGDFKENEQNDLQLTNDQCTKFRHAMDADTLFLAAHNMIDYSLFLGVAQRSTGGADVHACDGTPGEPFCFENGGRTLTLSNIDYLNDLNHMKKAESIISGGKFRNYREKMMDFVKKICNNQKQEGLDHHHWALIFLVTGLLCAVVGACLLARHYRKMQRPKVTLDPPEVVTEMPQYRNVAGPALVYSTPMVPMQQPAPPVASFQHAPQPQDHAHFRQPALPTQA